MENFPAEVLEILFHPLSKQEDIQKCYETNSKWRLIIENMFSNKSILILLLCVAGHFSTINMVF